MIEKTKIFLKNLKNFLQQKLGFVWCFCFKNTAFSLLTGLVIAGVFSATLFTFASPPGSLFNIGETDNPTCAPGDAYCDVTPPAGYSFGTNTFSGTGDFTTTGNVTASNLATSNWNTAYSWGNHAGLYLPIAGTATNSSALNGHADTYFQVAGSYLTSVAETNLNFTDLTTGDASITKHGLLQKLSGNTGQFLNGSGNWSTPSGSGDVLGPVTNSDGYIPLWNGANSKTLAGGIANNSANWNTAYGWGNHAGLYLPIAGTATNSSALNGHADTYFQSALTFANSIQNTTGTINLVGDSTSPGNSYYYGTNGSGTKGFFTLPSSMIYPGPGIAVSTGSTWGTSITDNSANWNTAYGWGNHAGLYLPIAGTATNSSALNGHADTYFQVAGSYLTSLSGALLATGATTGATSQAQTFTNGVNLSNLTSGRVPYATTAGLLTDNAGLTYNGTTLTSTSTGGAQAKLAYDASNYANITSGSTGNLTIATATGTTGGDIILTPTGTGNPTMLSDTGILVMGGNGNTNNEDLIFNFEATPNVVALSSDTGVTKIDAGSLAFTTTGLGTFGTLNLSGTSNQIVLQSAGITGTITATPTSSGKTWTFPNETGTVCTTGSVCSGYQAAGSFQPLATNLTSIGGLANASGWLHNNGSGSFAYSTPSATDVGLGSVTNDAQIKASLGTNVGDLISFSAASTPSRIADVAVGSYLASGGVNTQPTWATLNQAAIAGLTTASSPTFTALNLSGTSNQIVLQSAGITGTITATPTSSGKTWTFPDATGTVITTGNLSSITSTGTIASGTWNGTAIGLAYGGTNANITASNGGIVYSTASALSVLAGTSTANQILMSGASTTPAWSTATYPATVATSNGVMYGSGTTGFTTGTGLTYDGTTLTSTATGGAQAKLAYDASNYSNMTVDNAGTLTIGQTGTTGDIILNSATSGDANLLSDTGALVLGGNGNTNNEKLAFNFEANADTVGLSSTTGVTKIDAGSLAFTTTGLGTFGAGIITSKIYPSADSTTAIQINKADGTTNVFNVDTTNGRVGIGVTAPTAILHLKAGTATASTAPLKFTSGVNLATAEAGAMEFDGTNLYFTPATARKTIAFTDSALTGTWTGTAIGTQYGGTGQNWSAITVGALPYFSGTGAMSTLGAGTTGQILQTNTAAAPTWSTATYPATVATSNGVMYGSGTTGFTTGTGLTYDGTTLTSTSTGGAQAKFAYDASNYATSTTDSSGNLTIATATGTTGGNIILQPAGSGNPTFLSDSGSIVFGGNNNTNNEDLKFDFETTADLIGLSSSTGVTAINTGTLNLAINNSTPTAKLDIASTSTSGNDFLITNTGVSTSGAIATLTANSLTTGNVLALNATGATTGSAIIATGPASTGVTGNFTSFTSAIGSAGSLIYGAPSFTGAGVTGYGTKMAATDSTSSANTDYNIYSSLTLTGNAAKTATGLYSTVSTASTTADTIVSADLATATSGIITTGTRNVYGLRSQPVSTGASTGGTTNVYGAYLKSGGTVGAGGTVNSYGAYIANGTMNTTGTTTNTGLYVETPTGASNNYAAIFAGGNVGIGVTAPTAILHLKAGTATASTAPLKFTSGTNLTNAEAGAMEFTTDDLYFTITTGAARKGIILNDGTNLTSGRVPYATTNGRLTDSTGLTFSGTRLSPNYVTLAAGTASAGTAPLVFTSGTNLTNAVAGAMEFDGTNLYFSPSTTRNTVALYPTTPATTYYSYYLGGSGSATSTGQYNTGLGYQSLSANTTATDNTALGYRAMQNNTYAKYNTAVGSLALQSQDYNGGSAAWASYNTAVGYGALNLNYPTSSTNGYLNTAIGSLAGYNNTTGASNVFLGYKAGYRQTTNSNLLIIDNQDRTSAALEATNSLIYGVFNATPASQTLAINGALTITAAGVAQQKLAYDTSNYANFTVDSTGNLAVATASGTTGGDITFTPASAGSPAFLSGSGTVTLGGTGNTNNQDLSFDFETTSGSVALGTSTGVTDISWPGTLTLGGSTTGTLVTRMSNGAPTEADANGSVVINYGTAPGIYYRYGDAWHYAANTAGFQIPNYETTDPISGEQMAEKDFVLGQINEIYSEGTMHGVWLKYSTVIKQLTGQLSVLNEDGTSRDGKVSDIDLNNYFVVGIKNVLAAFGIGVSDKAGQIKTIRIEKMEMVDSGTGEIYCTWIENGEWQKVKGNCASTETVVPAVVPSVENQNTDGGQTPVETPAETPAPVITDTPPVTDTTSPSDSNSVVPPVVTPPVETPVTPPVVEIPPVETPASPAETQQSEGAATPPPAETPAQ